MEISQVYKLPGTKIMCITKRFYGFSLYTGGLIIAWFVLLICVFDGMRCIYILNSDQGKFFSFSYRFIGPFFMYFSFSGDAAYRFVTTAECILQVFNVLICMALITGIANVRSGVTFILNISFTLILKKYIYFQENAALLLPWLIHTCLVMGVSVGVVIIAIIWFKLNVIWSLLIYFLVLGKFATIWLFQRK